MLASIEGGDTQMLDSWSGLVLRGKPNMRRQELCCYFLDEEMGTQGVDSNLISKIGLEYKFILLS